jgi:TetR/AcrR family transcriptional repressor of nem operon
MYDTFGDKHKLFIDCLQSYITETLKDYKAIIPCGSTPMNTIERMIFQAVKRAFKEKDCMVLKSIFEMAPLDNDVKKILKNSTDAFVDIVKGLLLKAREQGEFKPDRNITETAIFIVASFAGFYQMQVLYDNRKMLDQMATDLIRYLH